MNAKHLDQAALRARFEQIATGRGADIEHVDGTYVSRPVQLLWEFWQKAAETEPTGQQLYAEIKKTSRYAYQRDWAGWPTPFPVQVVPEAAEGFVVKGGVGGQYRLEDVQLFVIDGEKKVRIR